MKLHSFSGTVARVRQICWASAVLLLFSSLAVLGQERSQDRDKPTLIEGKVVIDKLDGSDDEYFYQFTIGPGKLAIVFRVKASGTNAGATLDLFDAKSSRPILSNVLVQGVDGGSEQAIKSVELGEPANFIIMRIKGMRYGDSGGTGTYSVGIDGNAPALDAKLVLPPSSNRVTGELDGTEAQQSHSLSITGAGKLTLIFDVKAASTNAGANFDVIGAGEKVLLSDVLVQGVDSGSERISRSISFARPQVIIIRVKGIKYGSSDGNGIYSIQFDGPAKLAGP